MMKKHDLLTKMLLLPAAVLCFACHSAAGKAKIKPKVKKELTAEEKDSLRRTAIVYIAAGDSAIQLGDSVTAEASYETAYPMALSGGDKQSISKAANYLGQLYIKTGREKAGAKLLERVHTIAVEAGNHEQQFVIAQKLAETYSATQNFEGAHKYLQEITAMRDSVTALQQAKIITGVKQDADRKIKEMQAAVAQREQQATASLQEQQLQLYGSLAASFILLIIALVSWRKAHKVKKQLQKSLQDNQHIILREKQNAAVIEKLNQELRDTRLNPKTPVAAKENIQVPESKKTVVTGGNRVLTAEDKYRSVFLKLVPQRLHQIEDSLKKSDWQQIQRLIIQMEPQLLDSGMQTIKPLVDEIEKMDGTTSYLTWHNSVKEFCVKVQHKLEEMQS
jgi:hypothetical protein